MIFVFVTDNSGSMQDEQAILAENVAEFASAIMSGANPPQDATFFTTVSDSYIDPIRWASISSHTSSANDIENFLNAQLTPGIGGNGSERLFPSLWATFANCCGVSFAGNGSATLASVNPGQTVFPVSRVNENVDLFRLIVTLITDERLQDASGQTGTSDYAQEQVYRVKAFADAFSKIPNAPSQYETYLNIVYNKNSGNESMGWTDVVAHSNQILGPSRTGEFVITAADWGQDLQQRLGEATYQSGGNQTIVTQTIALNYPAQPGTLSVVVTQPGSEPMVLQEGVQFLQDVNDLKVIALLDNGWLSTLSALPDDIKAQIRIDVSFTPASLAQ